MRPNHSQHNQHGASKPASKPTSKPTRGARGRCAQSTTNTASATSTNHGHDAGGLQVLGWKCISKTLMLLRQGLECRSYATSHDPSAGVAAFVHDRLWAPAWPQRSTRSGRSSPIPTAPMHSKALHRRLGRHLLPRRAQALPSAPETRG